MECILLPNTLLFFHSSLLCRIRLPSQKQKKNEEGNYLFTSWHTPHAGRNHSNIRRKISILYPLQQRSLRRSKMQPYPHPILQNIEGNLRPKNNITNFMIKNNDLYFILSLPPAKLLTIDRSHNSICLKQCKCCGWVCIR